MRRLICILLLLVLAAPARAAEAATFFAMDTVMTINAEDVDDELINACIRRVYELDALFSVTGDDGDIARLNREGEADASPDTQALLELALDMCAQTGGALDITLYPVARAWGFTTGEYRIPDDGELNALMERVDYSAVKLENGRVSVPEGVMVDLGSVAKGYAADALVEMLRESGVSSGLLDLGGNIYCIGGKADGSPWRVGIRSPLGEGFCGVVSATDCAVVTSGNYERYFVEGGVRYGHIFDPDTGRPADSGLISVTVIGECGALCDALSTALYVMGPEAAADYLTEQAEADAILVRDDGILMITAGLEDSFVPMGEFEDWQIQWIGQ